MISPQKNVETVERKMRWEDCVFYTLLRLITGFIPIAGILLFLGAMFWAKARSPFIREWFTLQTADHGSLRCVMVMPKPIRPRPVIIFAHGAGDNLMNDGFDLREMAELGLATISLDYDQTDEAAFPAEMDAVRQYLAQQAWANTNAVIWAGFSLGANRMFAYALQHPQFTPQLLVQISGAGWDGSASDSQILTNLHCPVLLIHGEQDETFPVVDTECLAALLYTNKTPVTSKILPGLPHNIQPEGGVVFRSIGEYSLRQLRGKDCWQKYDSIAQWQAEALQFWLFCLPAAAWIGGWLIYWFCQRIPLVKTSLTRGEIILRGLAAILTTWAVAETAIHLVPPHLAVTDKTLAVARKYLVPPKEQNDFEALAAQPIWQGYKLKTLLEHAELAGYNRELINWRMEDSLYRDYVLQPVIVGAPGEQLNWRRSLWEEFYPRVRHEGSAMDAAQIVVRHLRERITVADAPNLPHQVPEIWLRQITDRTGFQIIYVAALRSVGVPARLDGNGRAEFYDSGKWQPAPPEIEL